MAEFVQKTRPLATFTQFVINENEDEDEEVNEEEEEEDEEEEDEESVIELKFPISRHQSIIEERNYLPRASFDS